MLDIALPGSGGGLEVCRHIRKAYPETAIIMVTAWGTDRDRITDFDTGADDYVVRPFLSEELAARIRAVLRLSQRPNHYDWMLVGINKI